MSAYSSSSYPLSALVLRDSAGASTADLTKVATIIVDDTPKAATPGANSVYDPSGNGSDPYSTNSSSTCFDDGGNDTALRVQVLTSRPSTINAIAFRLNLTLTSRSVSKFEST